MGLRYLFVTIAWLWIIPGMAADPVPSQLTSPSSVQSSLKDGLEAYRLGQFRRAHILLEPLAEGGETQAQFTLAMMYSSGNGVELDEVQAIHWFELAATQGHRDSAYFLAQIYEQGWGTTRSSTQAIHWYQRCSELADPRCMTHLGQLNEEKQGPTPTKDPIIAIESTIPPPSVSHPIAPVVPGPKAVEPIPPPAVTIGVETSVPVSPPLVAVEKYVTVSPPITLASPPSSPVTESNEPATTTPTELLGEDWVRAQKPTNYTLQILTGLLERDIRAFVRQYDLKGDIAMVSELRQGRVWYNLLYGSYKTAGAANKVRVALPPEQVKGGAWVRRFRNLQTHSQGKLAHPSLDKIDSPPNSLN